MRLARPSFNSLLISLFVLMTGLVLLALADGRSSSAGDQPVLVLPGADAARGEMAIRTFGCGACQVVPGISGATGRVGPKLEDLPEQMYVGGVLANTPENLGRWIQNPRHYSPRTAMPELGVSEQQARDMAAYLYTVR